MAECRDGPVDTGRVNSIKNSNRKPFRILSLDGGGVRAIMQATLLRRLNEDLPNLINEVDMFAGASAGSIVSAALCSGLTPAQTYDMWMDTAPKIFVEGYFRKFSTLNSTIGAAYNADTLQSLLSNTIGDKKLGQLEKKILIPSFRLDPPTKRWSPTYFHNFPGSEFTDLPLLDAVLRSAAAPTYFPIRDGYVDGGTFANNPALAAVSTALSNGIKLEDIVVFSLSTGNNPKFIPKDKYGAGNWGLLEWGPHIVDLLLDSGTESIDYTCHCLLQKQYLRLDPILPKNIDLDDATQLNTLSEIAENISLDATKLWLGDYWKTQTSPLVEPLVSAPKAAAAGSWCSIQ
eukprot:TRINITY_DN2784_c0_g1_i1.p1 TRINITY_DN2784_c0_g1~~TRINITY_DN2784_c0_g1_i1.p1  ORF type:complete len:346 (-),score=82.17 TRINITY_DN2784_c0_g1_i1:47-1084(-)